MNKKLMLAIIFTYLLTGSISSAVASIIYTYTGNQFNEFSAASPYDNSMSVSSSIELEFALGNNLYEQAVSPLSYTLNAGPSTLIDLNNTIFKFTTNQAGGITGWRVAAAYGPLINQGDTLTYLTTVYNMSNFSNLDRLTLTTCNAADSGGCIDLSSEFGAITDANGSWVVTEVSAVPVPASVWLLGSGLVGLVGLARRKN